MKMPVNYESMLSHPPSATAHLVADASSIHPLVLPADQSRAAVLSIIPQLASHPVRRYAEAREWTVDPVTVLARVWQEAQQPGDSAPSSPNTPPPTIPHSSEAQRTAVLAAWRRMETRAAISRAVAAAEATAVGTDVAVARDADAGANAAPVPALANIDQELEAAERRAAWTALEAAIAAAPMPDDDASSSNIAVPQDASLRLSHEALVDFAESHQHLPFTQVFGREAAALDTRLLMDASGKRVDDDADALAALAGGPAPVSPQELQDKLAPMLKDAIGNDMQSVLADTPLPFNQVLAELGLHMDSMTDEQVAERLRELVAEDDKGDAPTEQQKRVGQSLFVDRKPMPTCTAGKGDPLQVGDEPVAHLRHQLVVRGVRAPRQPVDGSSDGQANASRAVLDTQQRLAECVDKIGPQRVRVHDNIVNLVLDGTHAHLVLAAAQPRPKRVAQRWVAAEPPLGRDQLFRRRPQRDGVDDRGDVGQRGLPLGVRNVKVAVEGVDKAGAEGVVRQVGTSSVKLATRARTLATPLDANFSLDTVSRSAMRAAVHAAQQGTVVAGEGGRQLVRAAAHLATVSKTNVISATKLGTNANIVKGRYDHRCICGTVKGGCVGDEGEVGVALVLVHSTATRSTTYQKNTTFGCLSLYRFFTYFCHIHFTVHVLVTTEDDRRSISPQEQQRTAHLGSFSVFLPSEQQ
eukprot:CAMPEP_0170751908 /NCGR_PEP_ID=MMETSP0437-20130122/11695_1 /TAXON_ID=0 /ORGANISM="Sexangularia sp." /LENGTH=692 /DNA_ID=CAMNT_0011090961 /DNA_START=172 /DNA_END=2251 /DNA_ORIENTATION=+